MTANEYMKKIKDNLDSVEHNLEQIQCDDCISRQDVINAFYIQSDDDGWWTGTTQDVEELLKSLQSTQPKPKTGHWIKMFLTDTSDIDGQCSECGFIHRFIDGHTAQYNFCPNCGAKMD